MSGVKIPCPKCQSVLKLKDRSMLGKTGKCPKCGHKFELQEPTPQKPDAPVKFELVDEQPAVGKNVQWIPDSPTPAPPTTPPTAEPNFSSLIGEPTASSEPVANPLSFLEKESPAPAESVPSFAAEEPAASPLADITKGSDPVTPRRRRKRRRSSGNWIVVVVMLAIVGGGGYFIYQQMQPGTSGIVKVKTPGAVANATPAVAPTATATNSDQQVARFDPVLAKSPTAGQPIQLLHLPAGVRVAINLRPAELWSNEQRHAEFRASLGPLGTWLENQIVEVCRQQPSEIEELLVGLILGPTGTPPEIAAVIRLKNPQVRADLLTTYAGEAFQEFNPEIQIVGERAYRIVDDRTVSFCPRQYAEDMLSFESAPAITAGHIEQILKATDRQRLITLAFDPSDIDQHLEALFPPTAHLAIEKMIRWLGPEAQAATWSLHINDDFFTDLAVLGQNTTKPFVLKSEYQKRLSAVPEIMLTSVQKMNPQRSGYRKIIGRFPAMLKVLSMTTAVAVDGQYVRLGTLLPAKAGPNLALGSLLTWDESTRTDFSVAAVVTPPPKAAAPKTFAERLQTKMDVDFRRIPLQEAIAFISDEAKIPIEIDGDALKLAGFTKNMPQTHQEQNLTTMQAINTIVSKYAEEADPLVAHVSEKDNLITILTKKAATARNLETYDFSKLPQN
ncbi:zinc-ribbon domain-containing protein [Rubinisphaera margarita]|uniref:zinc-ribbon domain-containing protein n=1 Tax=Rubinisphaera margarita TaxID=2909586 RepID=UPI001EE803B7|nr:zinc-ribbon domain-containing protein [Rubinisphaera margarita]MCG6155101.1 zinc-ribbon domain-containing protein [Rubinisphaera margarita]